MKFNLSYCKQLMDVANPDNGGGGGVVVIDGLDTEIKIKGDTKPDVTVPPVEPIEPVVPPVEPTNPNPDTPPANGTSRQVIQIENEDGIADYILDEHGNATQDGVIVYTKDQLDMGSGDAPNPADVQDIHALISNVSGIELLDENEQPILFKEGVEGLAEREVFVKNTFYKKGQEEALDTVFSQNPDLLEMYSYKAKHGSLEGYVKQTDYASLTIDDNTSTEVLKSIMRDHLLSIGNDVKTIDRLIKLSENEETLRLDALESLEVLKTNKLEQDKQIIKQQQALAVQQEQELNDYYGVKVDAKGNVIDLNKQDSVYDKIVKTGKIGNIFIPKEGLKIERDGKPVRLTRNDLFAYFYNPVAEQNGVQYTQSEIDESKRMRDTDNILIQGIRNLTGGDLRALEETMKNVIRIKDAKKIINMTNGKPTPSKPSTNIDAQVKKGTAQIIMQ
jgi:hypothetical protein